MDRSVIVYAIFLVLGTTVSCKSLGSYKEDATDASTATIPNGTPTIPESSPKENHNSKRNVPIPLPSDNDKRIRRNEEVDCSSQKIQKTKRCKSLLREDPQNQLVSQRSPNSAVKHNAAESRQLAMARSLRDKLKNGEYNVGAIPYHFPSTTKVIENDDYICYCQEKSNLLSRKDGLSRQPLTGKTKPERWSDNKKMLPGESRLQQRPLYQHQPYPYEGLHQYLPNLLPGKMNPIPRAGNLDELSYLPYIYHINPSTLPIANQGHSPTRISVPFRPFAGKHDSVVGQRAPNSSRNQQTLGQRPSPTKHSTTRQRNSTASSKTTKTVDRAQIGQRKAPGNFNYDLQSVKQSPKHAASKTTPASNGDGLVGAVRPEDKSKTGSGTPDYSGIKKVTSMQFTSEVYDDDLYNNEPGLDTTDTTIPDLKANLKNILKNPVGDSLKDDSEVANTKDVVVGKSNPSQKHCVSDLKKNLKSTLESSTEDPLQDDPGLTNEEDVSSPLSQSSIDDPSKDPESENGEDYNLDDFERGPAFEQTTALISEGLPGESVAAGNINQYVTPRGFFIEDYTANNDDPLKDDHGRDNLNSEEPSSEYQEEANDSSMDTQSPEDDTRRNNEDLVNGDEEQVGVADPGTTTERGLPFCDNSLLQKSIKTVINNFATGDSAETVGSSELLGSARDDLMKEIVDVPNLKGILSLPPVERMVLDKVKNMLARVTGVPRNKFDGEWPTNVIRNNLHHSLAPAPASKTELPANTVEERQFKNGEWITSIVTLSPTSDVGEGDLDDIEKLRTSIKNLLRDPAVSMEAAKNPAVQNIIVQSMRNSFQNSTSDLIQGVLSNEVSLMEMETTETAITEDAMGQMQADDLQDVDMNELLKIAEGEAGITGSGSTTTHIESLGSSTENYKDTEVGCALSTQKDAQTEMPDDVSNEDVSSLGLPKNEDEASLVEKSANPLGSSSDREESITESPVDLVGATNDPRIVENLEEPSTSSDTKLPSPKTDSPLVGEAMETLNPEVGEEKRQESITESPCGVVASSKRIGDESLDSEEYDRLESVLSTTPFVLEEADSTKEVVGGPRSEVDSPDYTYLGKISVKKNNDDVESLQNSELFYVGDGVKLPLEIRKQSDGSYALSISRKVCGHLLNKECPCCVPMNGNVVRTPRKQPEMKEEKKKITKRESISVRETEQDLTDDSLQISMPVETFAKRYNLSLNLEKVQAPWNFGGKIDDPAKNGASYFGKREFVEGNLRSLLAVHGDQENGKPDATEYDSYEKSDKINNKYRRQRYRNSDKYRYERNINEKVNERVEIVTDVLNWLRDMILDNNPKS